MITPRVAPVEGGKLGKAPPPPQCRAIVAALHGRPDERFERVRISLSQATSFGLGPVLELRRVSANVEPIEERAAIRLDCPFEITERELAVEVAEIARDGLDSQASFIDSENDIGAEFPPHGVDRLFQAIPGAFLARFGPEEGGEFLPGDASHLMRREDCEQSETTALGGDAWQHDRPAGQGNGSQHVEARNFALLTRR